MARPSKDSELALKPLQGTVGRFYVRPGVVGVYALVYIPNGALYVGSTRRCIANRIGHHLHLLRKGLHTEIFQAEWDSSVEEDWEVRILEICEPSMCREREKFWMSQHDLLMNTIVGRRVWTPEVKAKMRIAALRVGSDPEERERRRQRALLQHKNNPGFAHRGRKT